jgi:trans-2,3-dihydro-3-hydroxyanthranilate isomerase
VKRHCYVVDAFTDRPLAGNSAGVVLDAEDLSTAELQRIAEELKHAETAFPLPAREPQAAFHLRWFTTFCEVGFCGHATLAALHVLAGEAQRLRVAREGTTRIWFGCKAGLLRAELSRESGTLRIRFETPPARLAPQPAEPGVLASLNLIPEVLDPRIPPHRSISEEGNLYLCVRDRDVLQRVRPDPAALPELAGRLGVIGFVPFTLAPTPGVDVALRAIFADHGVAEDPVTGSASAQLALLVHRFQPGPVPRRFVFSQGDEMGRPGRIEIEMREEPGSDGPRAWLSGSAVTTVRGELIIP